MTEPDKRPNSTLKTLARFSGLGISIAVFIWLFALGGRKLDEHFQLEKPWFTLLCVLLGLTLSMIYTLRELKRHGD